MASARPKRIFSPGARRKAIIYRAAAGAGNPADPDNPRRMYRQPMKTLVHIMVGVCLAALSVCGSPCVAGSLPLPSPAQLGFSISQPPGWIETRDAGPNSRVVIYSAPHRGDRQPPRLIIQVVQPQENTALEGMARELLSRWRERPGFRLLRREQGRFGGEAALRLAWLFKDPYSGLMRREQFMVRRNAIFYLISYTVPAADFKKYLAVVDESVNSFRFLTNLTSAGQADPLGTLMLGRVLAKSLGGPYYSPRYDNRTREGSLAVQAHREMMARFTAVLLEMSRAQDRVLELYEQLTGLMARQAAFVDREQYRLPDWARGLWQREKQLFRLAVSFKLLQRAQQGAVIAAAKGLPDLKVLSIDLAGVHALALLQQAISDQQTLIMLQLERVLIPSCVFHEALTRSETGLPRRFRRDMQKFNRRQADLMPQAVQAVALSIAHARKVALALALIKDFDQRLGRAYALALERNLPGLKAALQRAESTGLDRDSLSLGQYVFRVLGQTRSLTQGRSLSRAGPQFMEALKRLWASPAWAKSISPEVRRALSKTRQTWQKNIASGLVRGQPLLQKGQSSILPVKVLKGAATAIRSGAWMADYATQQAAAIINYCAYSPFRVNYQGEELTSNPELARLHDVRTFKEFVQVVKKTNEELGTEYLKGECGVGALSRGVQAIDRFGKVYVTGEAGYDKITGQLQKTGTPGVLGFLGGVAYGVVSDLPKAIMVPSNPKTSRNDKLMATVDLVMATGASVYALKGTASYLGKALTRTGRKGVQTTVKAANQVMKKAPQTVQAVYHSAKNRLTGLARQGAQKLKSLRINWLNRTAHSIKQAAAETGQDSFYKTLTTDLKMMTRGVLGDLTEKKGALEVLKDFSQNFTLSKLVEGGINNTFSNQVLKPMTVALLGEARPVRPSGPEQTRAPGRMMGHAPSPPANPAFSSSRAQRPNRQRSYPSSRRHYSLRDQDSEPKPSSRGGSFYLRPPGREAGSIDPIRTDNNSWGCPEGYALNYWQKKCVPRCPRPEQRWNPSIRHCQKVSNTLGRCPRGQVYSVQLKTCVSQFTGCPPGSVRSARSKQCQPVGRTGRCPRGQTWSPKYQKCMAAGSRTAPGGRSVNSYRHLPREYWPSGYVSHANTPQNTFFKDYPADKLPSGYRYSRTYLGGNLSLNAHASAQSAEKAVQGFIRTAKGQRAAFGESGAVQLRETRTEVKLRVLCRVRNLVISVSLNQHEFKARINNRPTVLVPRPQATEVMARAREWIVAAAGFARKMGMLH